MKRILFAYPEVAPLHNNGGIGTFVFEAATILAQSGHWQVDILADSTYGDGSSTAFARAHEAFRKCGVTLYDLDRPGVRHSSWRSPTLDVAELYDRHISALHASRRYDIIEFPDWKAPGFRSVWRKATQGAFGDSRLVLHLHGSTRDVWRWHGRTAIGRDDFFALFMEDYVKRYADIVVSPSEFLLDPVRRLGGSNRLLHRCGYPIQPVDPVDDVAPALLTIACCSRLELRKGQDLLAQATRQLAASGILAGCQLVFRGRDGVGDTRDGGSMANTLRRILHGQESWTIAEPLDRDVLAQWLRAEVAICVVPSRLDNYPNVVLEAARAGCVVVCSDGGGVLEVLRDYDIPAVVFPSGDVEALARQLRSAITAVRDGTWSRHALQTRFEFARARQAVRFIGHYEELAARPAPVVTRSPSPRARFILPFLVAQSFLQIGRTLLGRQRVRVQKAR